MIKVKILSHTPNPEKVICASAKLCYSNSNIDDIVSKFTREETEKFINKLISMGHESPLEHVTFTFGIEGVSRVTTHQLVRHRIASYSQQSQRYVKLDQFEYIIPPAIANNKRAIKIFKKTMEESQIAYDMIVNTLIVDALNRNSLNWKERMEEEYSKLNPVEKLEVAQDLTLMYKKLYPKSYNKIEKQVIEDARYVFPNACETKIIVTMNIRNLHHFFEERCCERAQWEIRELATEMLKQVKEVSPILFRNCGPKCVKGKCPEGNMSCGLSREKRNLFLSEF